MKTPTPETAEARMHQVRQWIVSGHSEHDITESIAEKWPDVESRPLIVDAMKAIAGTAAKIDSDLARGWLIEATKMIYLRAVEANDLPTALRSVKEIGLLSNY